MEKVTYATYNKKTDNLLKNAKTKGALAFNFGGNIEPHAQTTRIVIIGPSGSGKTTMFINLLKDFPRPIKSITYIAPQDSLSDEGPQKLKIICEKSKIKYNAVIGDAKTKGIQFPDSEKPEVVIFDDMYKIKNVESLVEEVFIRGRHSRRHGVYITQNPAHIPSALKRNYSYLIIHKSFFSKDTEDKFSIQKNTLIDKIDNDHEHQFLILKTGGIPVGWYSPPTWLNCSKVIETFKKIQGGSDQKIKTLTKLPIEKELEIKQGISNAGNPNVKPLEPIYEVVDQIPTFVDCTWFKNMI